MREQVPDPAPEVPLSDPRAESVEADVCASCDAPLPGTYCGECGERRLRPDEFSLHRLFADGLSDALSLDSKLWNSLSVLIMKPGQATVAYMSGRRAGLMLPVQLFLMCNLIYFFVQPYTGYSGYNTPLVSHMNRQVYSAGFEIRDRVEREIADRAAERARGQIAAVRGAGTTVTVADSLRIAETAVEVEEAVYPTRFDATGEVYARALVALIIPMIVAALWVVYLGRGVPLVKHVVFATHLHAWALVFVSTIYLGLLTPALGVLGLVGEVAFGIGRAEVLAHPLGSTAIRFLVEYSSFLLILPYVYLALRRAYGDRRVAAVTRTVLLSACLLYSTFLYRFLLFWVTFGSV